MASAALRVAALLLLETASLAAAGARAGAGAAFPCHAVAPAKAEPADVSELHPGHVSVVMAMGDSITAAFAARHILADDPRKPEEAPLEFRQDSFSIGEGAEEFWTLPFFLRHYNDSLRGYSSVATLPQLPSSGYLEPESDYMNVALSSATSEHLLRELDQLKTQTGRIPDFEVRWKVLTILIGANDVCHGFEACNGDVSDAQQVADTFEKNVEAALSAIEASLTRVYVNVVSLFSIASVRRATAKHHGILPCHLEARLIDECDCIDHPFSGNGTDIPEVQLSRFDDTVALVNKKIEALASKFNLRRPDIAVVAHMDWAGQDIPDFDYLSDLDCFHPSAFAHRVMAISVWNSMLSKPTQPRPINSSAVPVCPGPQSTFFTPPRPSLGSTFVI